MFLLLGRWISTTAPRINIPLHLQTSILRKLDFLPQADLTVSPSQAPIFRLSPILHPQSRPTVHPIVFIFRALQTLNLAAIGVTLILDIK